MPEGFSTNPRGSVQSFRVRKRLNHGPLPWGEDTMRVAFAEWPDGLLPSGTEWENFAETIQDVKPDLLVTDQLPFGSWLAGTPRFDRGAAGDSVALHAEGVQALASLHLPAVVTSRPAWFGDRLVNEAVVIEGEVVRFLHRKQILPDQEGWREKAWYEPGREGFLTADVLGVRVGVLLCTELMFTERARQYGAAGAELIVVPRSTPEGAPCAPAALMAAVVSGSYVVSSSRVGQTGHGPEFGGRGFAYAPDGSPMAVTSPESTLRVVDIDPGASRRQKCRYPCYLIDPSAA